MKITAVLIRIFVIYIILSFLLYLLPEYLHIGLPFSQSAIILSGSFIISVITLLVFARGFYSESKTRFNFTLTAIAVKFLLYLFLILFLVILSKNRSLEFILTFFVIYLSFTSYLLFSFLKLLKTKNIEK